MAANANEVKEIVKAMQSLAKAAKSLKALSDQALGYNSAQGLNWNNVAAEYPELMDEDGDFLEIGVSPADVSNVIGSLDIFRTTFWTTHGGNFEKLTTPIV